MVIFPASGPKPLYYNTFGQYLLNILKRFDTVGFFGVATDNYYLVQVNNQIVIFDFSDHYEVKNLVEKYKNNPLKIFKFHYTKELHKQYNNVYPFSPVSFYKWEEKEHLETQIDYTCTTDLVLNCQRPYGNAIERRSYVRDLLSRQSNTFLKVLDQTNYWKLINECLVHVFVPGARIDILDRGQFQYMAFGCCTISPKLNDILPWHKELIPGDHYIECKEDFSDLLDIIDWCKHSRQECIQIGQNAKELFNQTSTPEKLWEWIDQCQRQ